MTDTKHTPGPRTAHIVRSIVAERIKNARLIAAAPELLAACEMILEADGDLNAIDFGMIRAAIAKAEGN